MPFRAYVAYIAPASHQTASRQRPSWDVSWGNQSTLGEEGQFEYILAYIYNLIQFNQGTIAHALSQNGK